MGVRILLYEGRGEYFNVSRTTLLEQQHTSAAVVRVTHKREFCLELEKHDYQVVLVVADGLDWHWLEAINHASRVGTHFPLVVVLNEDDGDERHRALTSGAWHTIPQGRDELLGSVMAVCLRHVEATRERARSQEALRIAEEVLQKSQKSIALGVLLGSIAHEINNPLEGMGNLLYLAKQSYDDREYVQVCLDMAEAELNRVSEITKQMLSFHRDTRTMQDVAVTEILDGILSLFAAKLRERQIVVVRQYECAGWINAFPGELRQAFANIIANAIDAMEGGGRLTLRVKRKSGALPYLCVSIGDSGKGMPKEFVKHLGELFLTTKGEAGTGLGVWVSRRIVKKYEGDFRVFSSQLPERSGTVFRLCFPAPQAPTASDDESIARHGATTGNSGSASQEVIGQARRTA